MSQTRNIKKLTDCFVLSNFDMLLLERESSGVDGANLVKTKVFSAHPIRTTRPWEKYFSGKGVVSPRRMVALTITINLVG
jgi:hypothetical protein